MKYPEPDPNIPIDDEFVHDDEHFYYTNGLRFTKPYNYSFDTHTKARWFGKTIEQLCESEFSNIDDISLAFDRQLIRMNGEVADRKHVLKHGDFIQITSRRTEAPCLAGIEPKIIGESQNVIGVYKPSSIPCHPGSFFYKNTLLAFLKKELVSEQYTFEKAHFLNRLDKVTSGVVLLGKNKSGAQVVTEYHESHQLLKCYLALVEGDFPEGCFMVDAPIITDMGNRRVHEDGAPSMTVFEKVKSFESFGNEYLAGVQGLYGMGNTGPSQTVLEGTAFNGGYRHIDYSKFGTEPSPLHTEFEKCTSPISLIKCWPITGRCHQIRIHLKHIGHPILNDQLYNQRVESEYSPRNWMFIYLHSLAYMHWDTSDEQLDDIMNEIEENPDKPVVDESRFCFLGPLPYWLMMRGITSYRDLGSLKPDAELCNEAKEAVLKAELASKEAELKVLRMRKRSRALHMLRRTLQNQTISEKNKAFLERYSRDHQELFDLYKKGHRFRDLDGGFITQIPGVPEGPIVDDDFGIDLTITLNTYENKRRQQKQRRERKKKNTIKITLEHSETTDE
ncbi:hypothetical protein PCE1_002488 [Barthelona sp. PCE]